MNSFKSRRIRQVEPDEQPSAFAVYGGWAAPEDTRRLDPVESEREQRIAGAVALAELYARQREAKQ